MFTLLKPFFKAECVFDDATGMIEGFTYVKNPINLRASLNIKKVLTEGIRREKGYLKM